MRLQFAIGELEEVCVEHHEGGVWLDSVDCSLLDLSVSVLEVDSEKGGFISLFLSDLEGIHTVNLGNNILSILFQEWAHLLEDSSRLKWHYGKIY